MAWLKNSVLLMDYKVNHKQSEIRMLINNKDFLQGIIKDCRSVGIDPILFGGWAEEYHGKEPWIHRDIDFLVNSEDLSSVDELISNTAGWHGNSGPTLPN